VKTRKPRSGDGIWTLQDLSNARWRLRRLAKKDNVTDEDRQTVAECLESLNRLSEKVKLLP